MPSRRSVLFIGAVSLALAGCAGFPFLSGAAPQGSAQAFEMQGRVYVRFGAKAFSGSLRWQHAPARDEVWLGGPLGQTGAHILRDSSGATLTTADQQVYRAMSIDSLTREGLGWTLPLADLSYYVLGAAPPGTAKLEGPNAAFERKGWTVRWTPRDTELGNASPARLDLGKDDVEIRLVIDRLERSD